MKKNLLDELLEKKEELALIGLGYVGLPIALEFAKKVKVVGFDISEPRVKLMQKSIDPSGELAKSDFDGCDITFTSDIKRLKKAKFFIVAVPTPVDKNNTPDLTPVIRASETVGKVLKKGDYVVFESTVYPGATEEDCIPVIEKVSGLKFKKDFKVGYSPERINPGDKEHTLAKIVKVVSGCDKESLNIIAKTYELVITAGIHKAPTIKVAEAAKVIENTQRDLNIALMNELSIIFGRLGINTFDVLEAAGTKWNFLKFQPGLVGGHCIGVDPYYLTHKAMQVGYHPQVILAGRYINDSMGLYIAKNTVKKLIASNVPLKKCKVLVMGITFKEDVEDIRNSKVITVINELKDYGLEVDVVDPHAVASQVKEEYGISLVKDFSKKKYNAVVLAVPHKKYADLDEAYFSKLMPKNGILVDIKGLLKGRIKKMDYWSL